MQITRKRQRGAVLIVSLIMLVLLTLISISSMNSTIMQELMAANEHEYAVSFAAAESAVRSGESWLGNLNLTVKPEIDASCKDEDPPCTFWVSPTSGLWNSGGSGPAYYHGDNTGSWWQDHGIIFDQVNGLSLPVVSAQPRYVTEELSPPYKISRSLKHDSGDYNFEYFYQITGRGTARGDISTIIVQTTYGRIF
jgi:type IV pilus assembly protein PilX